jgi:hypothetical protein
VEHTLFFIGGLGVRFLWELPLPSGLGYLFSGILFLIGMFWLYRYLHKSRIPPTQFMQSYPTEEFALASKHYLPTKAAELYFQQQMMLILVLLLQSRSFALWQISVFFCVSFGLSHLLLLKVMGKFAWYFTFFATFGGIIFPWILLQIPGGYIWSYLLHGSFYAVSVLWLWKHP